MKPLIEVCVDRLDSVQVCADAGVDRIELCAALSEGGITPSIGFLRSARKIFSGKIMMMIRPRAGDFLYSDGELELMQNDIRLAIDHGADGVVFGCLLPTGEIDENQTSLLQNTAGGKDVTFHRAFDVTRDLSRSLETLISLGIPRVLTSGGEADVSKGITRLTDLVKQAAGRITVLPGGGVSADKIRELADQTRATEFHLSARRTIHSNMIYQRHDIPMGASQITPELIHKVTDPLQLQSLLSALASHL
jgi:copper homeostasis protein